TFLDELPLSGSRRVRRAHAIRSPSTTHHVPDDSRLALMRQQIGANADQNLLVDTRATGHLLSAPQGLNHFLLAAREASAEVIVLDPLYSAHDQDENDTRSMAALGERGFVYGFGFI